MAITSRATRFTITRNVEDMSEIVECELSFDDDYITLMTSDGQELYFSTEMATEVGKALRDLNTSHQHSDNLLDAFAKQAKIQWHTGRRFHNNRPMFDAFVLQAERVWKFTVERWSDLGQYSLLLNELPHLMLGRQQGTSTMVAENLANREWWLWRLERQVLIGHISNLVEQAGGGTLQLIRPPSWSTESYKQMYVGCGDRKGWRETREINSHTPPFVLVVDHFSFMSEQDRRDLEIFIANHHEKLLNVVLVG